MFNFFCLFEKAKSFTIDDVFCWSDWPMMLTKFSDDINVHLEPMKPETAGYFYYNRDRGKKRFCVTTFEDSLKVLFIIILFIDLLDDFLDTPRLFTVQAQISLWTDGIVSSSDFSFILKIFLYFSLINHFFFFSFRFFGLVDLERNFEV